jgi:integrase
VGVYHKKQKQYITVSSQAEAEEVKAKWEALINAEKRGTKPARLSLNSAKNRTPTVEEYYHQYLTVRMDTLAVKPSTRKAYISAFKNHILPEFGEIEIGAVTDTEVELFVGKLGRAGLAYNTIKGILDNFSGLFSYAMKKKEVLSNPVKDKSEFYAHAPAQIEIQPLTQYQSDRLLEAARQRYPEYYPILLTALHSGLRIGEILGLQIGDFDFTELFVNVRRTICTIGGKRETSTKSTRRRVVKIRRVDITAELAAVLKAHHAQSREWAFKRGKPLPEWLFFTRSGRPVDSNKVSATVLKDVLQKAGIPVIRFHDLRHTYAAMVLRDSKDIVYLKEQLGHTSIKTTIDTYGHMMPGQKRPQIAFPGFPKESTNVATG